MFTRQFWRQAIERAVKTGAQTFLTYVGADKLNVLAFEWSTAGGFAAGGVVLSIAFSLVSEPFGPEKSPSAV